MPLLNGGKFIREQLLCQEVPMPPSNVDTSIPEPSATARTLRERVAVHLENPGCAGCHLITDPIGLALENFDGLGQFRLVENGADIDPSGDFDGLPFTDAWELAGLLADDPDFTRCVARRLFRHGTATVEASGQLPLIDALAGQFARNGHRFLDLLIAFLESRAFRTVGPIADAEEP